jgi:hypothetical protein
MNNLYDVLEICLQELENGADLETVLVRYPDLAGELRPILKASIMARTRSTALPAPSPDAVRRGRAKLLQHAAQLREAKVTPRKRMIPFFQRLAISFALTSLLLSSGTGLVSASSSALPGEHLYPVKLTWENVRLLFTFNPEYHEILEHTFENERLHEVNELLVEGRDETIRFAGVYMEVNAITYVSGIHVVILDTSSLPTEPLSNGMAVEVTGHTNAEGFVDIESITLLPAGSVVPAGKPVEVETNHEDNGKNIISDNGEDGNNDNGGDDNENDHVNENSDTNSNDNENSNDSLDDNSADDSNKSDSSNDNDNKSDSNDSSDDSNDDSSDDSSDD